ncbi:hypothetical protein HUT06_27485 [Actinomadura sp. NAK00032]|uniref:hypothetical protein n=1 Tax=Actinomadura sp. NAK00032 TaxID=2742128 RepID=UPI0015915FB3|nr:hypothetical protein [Actinomadura sp. NAK00032]QKW37292.1 hypothetical protein HUT06_27485 [Actinomadura sp. NAK00032]
MVKLRGRRLNLVARLLDADQLTIPVRRDSKPLIWDLNDFRMLGVSRTGPFQLDFLESENFQSWGISRLEELVEAVPEDVFLYVDRKGPLLPIRSLQNFNFPLFRMMQDGSMEQLREKFPDALVYRSEGDRAVFTSLLALEASRGITAAWEPVRGHDVLAEGEVVIDPGHEHQVALIP